MNKRKKCYVFMLGMLHPLNMLDIIFTLDVLKEDTSNVVNELHPRNMAGISITLDVLKEDKSNDVNELHPSNMGYIVLMTQAVS